jgi:hypothetical protein
MALSARLSSLRPACLARPRARDSAPEGPMSQDWRRRDCGRGGGGSREELSAGALWHPVAGELATRVHSPAVLKRGCLKTGAMPQPGQGLYASSCSARRMQPCHFLTCSCAHPVSAPPRAAAPPSLSLLWLRSTWASDTQRPSPSASSATASGFMPQRGSSRWVMAPDAASI